jgi:Spy/CpxP family protein refolding chaperone
MRTRWMVVLALSALMALAQTSSAQNRRGRGRGGFGRGMMASPLSLLTNAGVQKELNLTDEQKDKIKDAAQPVNEKRQSLMQGLQDLSREERQAKFAEINKELTAANKEAMAKLKGVLQPKQEKRLHQIETQVAVQFGGPNAFLEPKLADKLQLTDDQKSSIKTIVSDQQKDLEGLQGRERFTKMAEQRKEGIEKVMGVLTDKQKTEWKELTGKPFQMQFGRGGRGRRGGGNPPPI